MRIISKFKDYYDSASAYGIDKECVYVRKTEDIPYKKYRIQEHWSYCHTRNKNYEYPNTPFVIGFAGQIITGICIYKRRNVASFAKEIKFFYSAQDVTDYMQGEGFDISGRKYFWSRSGHNYSITIHKELEAFFAFDRNSMKHLFRDHHCPVWMIKPMHDGRVENTLILNPCLRVWEFAKVKDPVTAFQEVHQYLSGVLGNKENEMVKISDKHKAQARGFDKWSFKNLPGKKRGRHE